MFLEDVDFRACLDAWELLNLGVQAMDDDDENSDQSAEG